MREENIFCDGCGRKINMSKIGLWVYMIRKRGFFEPINWSLQENLELCESCYKKLQDWKKGMRVIKRSKEDYNKAIKNS